MARIRHLTLVETENPLNLLQAMIAVKLQIYHVYLAHPAWAFAHLLKIHIIMYIHSKSAELDDLVMSHCNLGFSSGKGSESWRKEEGEGDNWDNPWPCAFQICRRGFRGLRIPSTNVAAKLQWVATPKFSFSGKQEKIRKSEGEKPGNGRGPGPRSSLGENAVGTGGKALVRPNQCSCVQWSRW